MIAEGTSDELKSRVGGERLEVTLRDPAHERLALQALGEEAHAEFPLVIVPGGMNIADAVRALDEAGVTIEDIAIRRPTLDDVFLVAHRPRRGGGRKRCMRSSPTRCVILKRNLIRFRRQPEMLAGYTIQPIMFVLLFVYVFGGSINTGMDYVDFLIPGILVQNITFGGALTAVGLVEDLNKGLIDRFRSLPMARSAVLTGRTLADVVVNILMTVIVIIVGLLVGFSFSNTTVPNVLYGLFLLLLFGYGFSWLFALIGLISTSAENAQQFGFILIFPLTFISSAFVPVENMPPVLEAFANVNPFTITVDAMRHLFVGTPAGNSVWGATLWSLGLIVVFAPIAVLKYRRVSAR